MKDEDVDPNEVWRQVVTLARASSTKVDIIVQYEAPSDYAGRRVRLVYDPSTDQQTHQWLD